MMSMAMIDCFEASLPVRRAWNSCKMSDSWLFAVGLVGAGWEWLNRLGHRIGNFHIGFLQITIVT